MSALPIAGRRVLVTRAAHQAGKLSEALRALGAESVEVPVLEIRPPESFEALDRALRGIESYDWLILTSANAADALGARASQKEIDLSRFSTLKVAAIGTASRTAAEKIGLKVSLVPASYVAESLVRELAPQIANKKILLARAEVARDVIPDALRAAGATVDVVDAYRNAMPEAAPELLRAAMAGHLDAATFASSSSVTHLAEAARQAGIEFPFAGVAAVSIGPITSQTLREAGWEPAAEAGVSDIPGMVAAVERLLRR
ncbi:MAG: uroporphyrinogen-III synthase [Terracidiphilus sp.]|jgi:uroporphyrinogen-III synthase/uroporphyrinogen III methyltransferase/synthase